MRLILNEITDREISLPNNNEQAVSAALAA